MAATPEATELLWAVSKAWLHPLRVIPGISWDTNLVKKYTRRVLEVSYAIIVGTMLEMWDSIERDLNNHPRGTPHAEAGRLYQVAYDRTELVMRCVRNLNDGTTTAVTCNNRVKELITPVNEDARIAFEWTAPDGVVEREELDIARLTQSMRNVRTLNGMLNHNDRDELERYNNIVLILDEVEAYLTGSGQERTQSETALQQFTINLARFMTTNNNHNRLPWANLTHTTRNSIEVRYALALGLMLEMWDSIERDFRKGGHQQAHAEAEALKAVAFHRTQELVRLIDNTNNRITTTAHCMKLLRDIVDLANQDARTAFCWTAPDGMAEREELDIARLQQSTKDVRTLNGMLNPELDAQRTRYGNISLTLAETERYLAPGTEHTPALTIAHQFKVNFARFMATDNNYNKLP